MVARKTPRGLAVPGNTNNGKDTAHGLVPLATAPAHPIGKAQSGTPCLKSALVLNRLCRRCPYRDLVEPYSRPSQPIKNVTRVVERSNGQSFSLTCRHGSNM